MKRAILLLLMGLALLGVVSGTVAFFTDTVETRGTVTGGNLGVVQHEYERIRDASGTPSATLRRFTQGQVMYPGVLASSLSRTAVQVGAYTVDMYDASVANFVDKIVTAENTGSLPSYVRTFVAVPARYEGENPVDWLHLDFNTQHGWTVCDAPIRRQMIDGAAYDIYYATNLSPLQPKETSSPSLLGFYLDPRVTTQSNRYQFLNGGVRTDLGTTDELHILVATQAAQSNVFDEQDGKSAAQHALNTTFGIPEDGFHPWAKFSIAADQQMMDTLLATAQYGDCIALRDGEYTLPAALPTGVRIRAMGTDVRVSSPAFTGFGAEMDGLTFTSPVAFTGHGNFEDCTFRQGWHISPTTGDCRVQHCTFAVSSVGEGSYQVIVTE